jgi:hypothetical protein
LKEIRNSIMANIICWICRDNLSYGKYEETKLLDEDGSKPCLECIAEALEEDNMEEAVGE